MGFVLLTVPSALAVPICSAAEQMFGMIEIGLLLQSYVMPPPRKTVPFTVLNCVAMFAGVGSPVKPFIPEMKFMTVDAPSETPLLFAGSGSMPLPGAYFCTIAA